jgi:hypothetical protein
VFMACMTKCRTGGLLRVVGVLPECPSAQIMGAGAACVEWPITPVVVGRVLVVSPTGSPISALLGKRCRRLVTARIMIGSLAGWRRPGMCLPFAANPFPGDVLDRCWSTSLSGSRRSAREKRGLILRVLASSAAPSADCFVLVVLQKRELGHDIVALLGLQLFEFTAPKVRPKEVLHALGKGRLA